MMPPRNFSTAFVDERLREHWQMQARRAEELEREIRDEVLREAAGIEAPFVCDAPPLRAKHVRCGNQNPHPSNVAKDGAP